MIDDPTGVQAAALALEETDHTRLPSWLVARIAVETANSRWREDYEARVVRPLRREIELLRAELAEVRELFVIRAVDRKKPRPKA